MSDLEVVYAWFSCQGAKWIQSGSILSASHHGAWSQLPSAFRQASGIPSVREQNVGKENEMNLHGASAAQEAQRLAMIANGIHRDKVRSAERVCCPEAEPPTLAAHIVYGVTVVGFLVMCVLAALP